MLQTGMFWIAVCLAVLPLATTDVFVNGRQLQQLSAHPAEAGDSPAQLMQLAVPAAALEGVSSHASVPTLSHQAQEPSTLATEAAPSLGPTDVLGVSSICPPSQIQWPVGSGYCWVKKDSGGAQVGPGGNVFKGSNVAVNAQGQLVLTILNPKQLVIKSSCGEVYASRSYGYGDYIFVVATNPALINPNLVGAPFIYDTDIKEFDFEFTRWSVSTNQNSQFVVQDHQVNPPVRFNISTINTTHRMRWTAASVVFESYLPINLGGGLIRNWTYTGPYNFAPQTERVHINHWISKRIHGLPTSSTFVSNCFKFCAADALNSCSSPLGSKPRCSATALW